MASLDREIAKFEQIKEQLEREHMGEFVVIAGENVLGIYEREDEAVRCSLVIEGPCLVRRIGDGPHRIPISAFHFVPARA